ncbi:MAG: polysaccharide deacetylase family protein [Cyanobacteria bacterium P01_G01_bin.49]
MNHWIEWCKKIFQLGGLLILSFLLILAFIGLLQPPFLFEIVLQIAPGVKYFAQTHDKIVAITIDDGPNFQTTPKILETLENYQAPATFFLISERIEGNEEIINTMIDNGHEIGHHMVRDEPSIQLSTEYFQQQFLVADKILNQFFDNKLHRVHWFRPGGGWYNSQMIAFAKKQGYQSVLGSIFPYDTHIPSAQFASYQILLNLRPGAIIVLHDSGKDDQSGDWGKRTNITLNKILPEIKRRGYQTVTLSDLFSQELQDD